MMHQVQVRYRSWANCLQVIDHLHELKGSDSCIWQSEVWHLQSMAKIRCDITAETAVVLAMSWPCVTVTVLP
jgi:hypothetical protein